MESGIEEEMSPAAGGSAPMAPQRE